MENSFGARRPNKNKNKNKSKNKVKISKKLKEQATRLKVRTTKDTKTGRVQKTEKEIKQEIQKKMPAKKTKWTNKKHCQKLLGKQIAINTIMFNNRKKFTSREQAIAVAYSQVKKDLKKKGIRYCNKWLKPKNK